MSKDGQVKVVFYRQRRAAGVAAFVIAALLFSRGLRAEEGISVQGLGEATARPSQVEIPVSIGGDSELASDALVKFRDSKRKAAAAIDALKNPDLAIVSDGISFNTPIDSNAQLMMQRGQSVPAGQKVQVLEAGRLVLSNTDKMESDALLEKVLKIIDVAKDAGFVVGPSNIQNIYEQRTGQQPTLVTFKLPDAGNLRDKAFKAAIEDAKAKGQKIAEVSGVKLGRILSITQMGAGSDSTTNSVLQMIYGIASKTADADKGIAGPNSADLRVRVSVQAVFEIVK
jgi:uncharacterized protein YggE